jgi:hypothetical protein
MCALSIAYATRRGSTVSDDFDGRRKHRRGPRLNSGDNSQGAVVLKMGCRW